jgi:hypothetical protein
MDTLKSERRDKVSLCHLSAAIADFARVPDTLTERDYTTKDGESRAKITRGVMKGLAALFFER